jgi:hypothetical protein
LRIRPRTVEPTGRLLLEAVENCRNALVVVTELMATVDEPLALLVAVPLCTEATVAWKQLEVLKVLLPTDCVSVKSALTAGVVATRLTASTAVSSSRTHPSPGVAVENSKETARPSGCCALTACPPRSPR